MEKAKEFKPGVPDLSTLHEPVTDTLFKAVMDKSEYSKFQLTEDQLEKFWRDGFLLNVPLLSTEECDLILEEYKYFMGDEASRHPGHDMLYEFHSNQSGDPNNVLMHCLGHWRLTKLFHDLIFHPKVVVPCSQMLVEGKEKPVRFWHDQLFAKPARHGGNVAWHQDYSYWTRTQPMMHVTVHIALDEQTEENGTIMYIPGSHRWTRDGGKPLPVLDFNFVDMEGIKTILTTEELRNFKPIPAKLKKGEVSFHHCLSVHGSHGNKSAVPRRAAVLNYFADGVYSDSDDELLPGTGIIPKGQKMSGQFYPLLYDPAWAK